MRGNPLRTVGIFSSSGCAHAKERQGEQGTHFWGTEAAGAIIVLYSLMYLLIWRTSCLGSWWASHWDKEWQGLPNKILIPSKVISWVCSRHFPKSCSCYPTQRFPTTFKQGTKMQMTSDWTIGGEAQRCEPCYTAEQLWNLKPGHYKCGVSPGYHPKGVCLDPRVRKERHLCRLVGEDPEHWTLYIGSSQQPQSTWFSKFPLDVRDLR